MLADEVAVTVRQMTESDIDGVLALGGSMISAQDLMALQLGGPLDLSFVAEAEGRIIGFNLAHILYHGIPLVKVAVIHGIVVEYEYRRQGIGNKLVEQVFKACREKGVGIIRALMDENDARLQKFVGELGFRHSPIANYDKTL